MGTLWRGISENLQVESAEGFACILPVRSFGGFMFIG
jgi:hypothetical protein